MDEKFRVIFELLLENKNWVPASLIVSNLQVSKRTVRKYIAEINKTYPDLIRSSNLGYQLNTDLYYNLNLNKKGHTFETPLKRRMRLLRMFLKLDTMNFDQIMNEFFISESTLNSDINYLKKYIREFNLKLKFQKGNLLLVGNEIDKRNLLKSLITEENYSLFNLENLENLLSHDIDINELSRLIKDVLSENNIHANDYTLQFLVLHILVSINRIKSNREVQNGGSALTVSDNPKYAYLAEALSKEIESKYEVSINDQELDYLEYVLGENIAQSHSVYSENAKSNDIAPFVSLTKRIIEDVETKYVLDLSNENFTSKFTFHLKNLYSRLSNDTILKSPFSSSINNDYPLIYDIAIYIAHQLGLEWGYTISLSEIDYLSLHIGAYLASTQQGNTRLNCIVYYKKYYDNHLDVVRRLKEVFSEELIIEDVRRFDSDDPIPPKIDLVIATGPEFHLYQKSSVPTYILNPLLSYQDIKKFRLYIDDLLVRKEARWLKSVLFQLLMPHLFKRNIHYKDQEAAVRELTNEVYELGYVEADFVQDVLEREALCSTVYFNQLAIPHALTQSAKKSFISIVINDEPMPWGKQQVRIICLFCLKKDEQKEFKLIFEKIIEVFSSVENLDVLLKCDNYTEFMECLTELIKKL